MSNKEQIVCVGHDENALIFNASGIKGIVVDDKSKINEVINKLIEDQVKIILISNHFNKEILEYRKNLDSVYPIFLELALDGSENKDGVEQIRKDVERATGINIF